MLEDEVIGVIKESLMLKDGVNLNSKLVDDLGADSLDLVEMIMIFEDRYRIEIPDEDVKKIVYVQDVVDYIKAHAAENMLGYKKVA